MAKAVPGGIAHKKYRPKGGLWCAKSMMYLYKAICKTNQQGGRNAGKRHFCFFNQVFPAAQAPTGLATTTI